MASLFSGPGLGYANAILGGLPVLNGPPWRILDATVFVAAVKHK